MMEVTHTLFLQHRLNKYNIEFYYFFYQYYGLRACKKLNSISLCIHLIRKNLVKGSVQQEINIHTNDNSNHTHMEIDEVQIVLWSQGEKPHNNFGQQQC